MKIVTVFESNKSNCFHVQSPREVIKAYKSSTAKRKLKKSNKQFLLNNSSLSKMKIQEKEIFLYMMNAIARNFW